MEFMRYINILLKRRKNFFYCLGIFFAGYLLYCFLPAKIYRCEAKIIVISKDIIPMFFGSSAPSGIDTYDSGTDSSQETWSNSVMEILKSPQNALQVIQKLNLKDKKGEYLRGKTIILNYKYLIYLLYANRGIHIYQDSDQSKVYNITGYSTDPHEAENLANTYSEIAMAKFADFYREELKKAIVALEQSAALTKTKIDDIERKRQAYEERENIVNITNEITTLQSEQSGLITEYKKVLADLENQWFSLKQFYTPEHPDSKGLLAKIAQTKNNIRQTQEYYDKKLSMLNKKQVETNKFYRELNNYNDVYSTLTRNLEQSKSLVNADVSNIIKCQPAILYKNVDDNRIFPRGKLFIAVFALMGICCWLFSVFFMEYIEQGFCYQEEIKSHLNAQLLETIPLYKKYGMKQFIENKDFLVRIQNLITSLISLNKSEFPKSINIVSTSLFEGTSTILIYLGLMLAKNKKKVLLIDGNLKRPAIGNYFNISLSKGISDVFLESIKPEEILVPSGIEGLTITSFGLQKEDLSLSMRMDKLRQIYHVFEENFDIVLIDSPPITEVNIGILFSQLTKSTVFLVAAETSSINAVKNAFQTLIDIEVKVAGIVLNKMRE